LQTIWKFAAGPGARRQAAYFEGGSVGIASNSFRHRLSLL
jgi:hypothetical protein